jgi:hypothetical protein
MGALDRLGQWALPLAADVEVREGGSWLMLASTWSCQLASEIAFAQVAIAQRAKNLRITCFPVRQVGHRLIPRDGSARSSQMY